MHSCLNQRFPANATRRLSVKRLVSPSQLQTGYRDNPKPVFKWLHMLAFADWSDLFGLRCHPGNDGRCNTLPVATIIYN
jgi:hypothetical protein